MRALVCLLAAGSLAVLAQTSVDLKAIDRSVSPCDDFFQYACGSWIAANPVPADQSRYSRFNELRNRNQEILRGILEDAARDNVSRGPVDQKIGDYYAACMDEAAIEKRGVDPLKPHLDKIQAIPAKYAIAEVAAAMHRSGAGALFSFSASPDYKNSSQVIASVDQGGLSLPDREYYLAGDARSVRIREAYAKHLEAIFGLLGEDAAKAQESAATVLAVETALAKVSLDRVARRNPEKRYNKMTRHELGSLAPEVNWARYFELTGAPAFETLNVAAPTYFRGLDEVLNRTPLDKWKVYLTYHVVRAHLSMLPKAFRDQSFAFYSRVLTGQKEPQARWKTCSGAVDGDLPEALGQKYVERAFAGESKQRMLELVKAVTAAMAKDIETLEWMTPATRKMALEKLHAVANKIGYPDKWRDYSAVTIARDNPVANSVSANEYRFQRRVGRIGKDADPTEWRMSPPTVNAYYSPLENNINFPAGILQLPFFDAKRDAAVNFGGIGAVIGHEITHGFDDSGRKFDARGNLRDWWTPEDAREFERRTACIGDQYSSYTVANGEAKINGKLTMGENVADFGGVRVAYLALMDSLARKLPAKLDGFTPQQRFFLGYAQVWCGAATVEAQRQLALTDPHSPGQYRVNGVVSNMKEFAEAFGCKAGQPMVRENACRVW